MPPAQAAHADLARDSHRGRALLRMAVGDDAVAVAIDEVREILEVGRLTALPRTPGFVRGVMNLRGAVVPVIDLLARLGRAPAQIGRRSCVVVVETAPPADADADADDDDTGLHAGLGETLVVGLLVDAVYEVFDAPPGEFEPVPPLGTHIDAAYLQGMSRVRNEVIGVLALERVLAQQELTALIADA
jgi:purine-binding chemotaxis protein CheW